MLLTGEKELSDGDRIRFEIEVQNSVSVTQFIPNSEIRNRRFLYQRQ